jgi:hypothetical protein
LELFKKNISALKKIEPHLAERLIKIESRRDRLIPYLNKNLKIQIKDNLKFYDIIVVLGFGTGNYIKEIIKQASKSSLILVIDNDIQTFKAVLEKFDLREIFQNRQVSLSIDEDLFLATRGRIEQYFGTVMLAVNFKIFKNPISINNFPSFYKEVIERLSETLYIAYLNLGSILLFGYEREKNTFKNLLEIFKNPGVNELFNKFQGYPSIVVASGPSLNKNVSQLKYAKGKAVIICVDTALKVLYKHGIEPDFVVTIETRKENYLCFKDIKLSNCYLVTSAQSFYKTVSKFKGKKFFLHSLNPILEWYSKEINLRGEMSTGSNVGATSFNLAINMGTNPVILIGYDLSYPDKKVYADEVDNLFNKEYKNFLNKRKTVLIESIEGKKVVTTEEKLTFLRWFEREIYNHKDILFIDATEGGAKIKGTKILPLKKTINTYCQKNIKIKEKIDNIFVKFTPPDIKKIISLTKILKEEYESSLIICKQAEEILKKEKIYKKSRIIQIQNTLSLMVKDILSLPNFISINKLLMESLLHRLKRDRSEDNIKNYKLFFKEIKKFSSPLKNILEKLLNLLEEDNERILQR